MDDSKFVYWNVKDIYKWELLFKIDKLVRPIKSFNNSLSALIIDQ